MFWVDGDGSASIDIPASKKEMYLQTLYSEEFDALKERQIHGDSEESRLCG